MDARCRHAGAMPSGNIPSMSSRPADFSGSSRSVDRFPDSRVQQLRLPPQSVEAEQAVLGGLMLAPEAFDRVSDLLGEHDFYRRDHQLI